MIKTDPIFIEIIGKANEEIEELDKDLKKSLNILSDLFSDDQFNAFSIFVKVTVFLKNLV